MATAKMMLLDNPGDLSQPVSGQSEEERLRRMRRLLAARAVNDLCAPVLDWASAGDA